MTDSAPSGTTHDRRICTGDWVRLAGNAPSLRGVGKVVDAEFDAGDHTMRTACVDMGTRSYWVPPANLARVLPDDEVLLCELALERGLIDAERDPARVERLERALSGLRQGTTRFVRTPGLLDVLWGGSIHADPDHGSREIAGFLDEALDALSAARHERPAAAARRVIEGEDDGIAIRALLAAEARARAERALAEVPRKLPREPLTPVPSVDVLPRILRVLGKDPLVLVAQARGLPIPPDKKGSGKVLAATVLAAGVPVEAVLAVLTLNQLRQACLAVGLDIYSDAANLRARLIALSS